MAAPFPSYGPAAYPSSDPGFEALPLDTVLDGHRTLLGRIKLCFGEDRSTFERELLPLVHGYARFVHLLPATADNYFHMPGGLLQLGLETAFFSLQGTDAHIFSGRATISERREMEPRWRIATFIGGLCCEVHRVLTHMIVTTADGQEWPAFLGGLVPWLAARGADRYFVRWRPQSREARGLGLFALPHVVPAPVLQMLASGNTVLVPQLMASISGLPLHHEHNVLDGLVRRSMALVIDRNLLSNADRYGKPQYGSHLERYLVDALRRLVAGHSAWTPNRDKSRVWLGPEGLFLVWPGAADDVLALLESDQLAGIPKSPQTLLEILLEADVLVAAEAEQKTWPIQPPGAKAHVDAVKLTNPAILLAGLEPATVALESPLIATASSPPSPKSAPSRADAQAPSAHPPAPAAQPTTAPETLSVAPADLPSPLPPSNAEATKPTSVQDRQLSLLEPDAGPFGPDSAAAIGSEGAVATEPPPTLVPAPVAIGLQAPMRLNPAVRSALAAIVEKLNGSATTSNVSTVADGVFVPLEEFVQRGIQPGIAIRAMDDARMLRRPQVSGPPTVSRRIRDLTVLGVVLSPVHVIGLDPHAFTIEKTGVHPRPQTQQDPER